ncbi:hypothetical protein U9M48_040897 [Paspalum notatum var. saurae]|uniref:Uncharacterized protein n=1 Tax=Paspalum notatum var. saurae TaxID=547442 RepID=A0AAQ3UPE0_PASNO
MLIHELDAKEDLEFALQKVMETIKAAGEGKQLEAVLAAASQIGYVIPKYFAKELDENLAKKLVHTLRSNRKPCPEYPRIRRALIELVICIVRSCPPEPFTSVFRDKGVKDALDMVRRTSSSRLEKYMVFVGGEGMVLESTPLADLVDEAKKLLFTHDQATQTKGA